MWLKEIQRNPRDRPTQCASEGQRVRPQALGLKPVSLTMIFFWLVSLLACCLVFGALVNFGRGLQEKQVFSLPYQGLNSCSKRAMTLGSVHSWLQRKQVLCAADMPISSAHPSFTVETINPRKGFLYWPGPLGNWGRRVGNRSYIWTPESRRRGCRLI